MPCVILELLNLIATKVILMFHHSWNRNGCPSALLFCCMRLVFHGLFYSILECSPVSLHYILPELVQSFGFLDVFVVSEYSCF